MILSLLGALCTNVACANDDGYKGWCLDLGSATHKLPGASEIYIALQTSVAASYADLNETYQFKLNMGTTTDETNISAGDTTILETPAIAGNDARVATAGAYILRCTLPIECLNKQYIQLYYDRDGTTTSISVNFHILPSKPRTNYNIQVESSNVGTP